jgi:Astacin (Peptidase family M12A)/FG-GAP-like repeat
LILIYISYLKTEIMATQSRKDLSGNDDSKYKNGEYRSGPIAGTAYVQGATFNRKALQYANVDGLAIFEGDIILGTIEEVQKAADAGAGIVPKSIGITGQQFRWPNATIPFDIDPALPNQQRVTDAIAHWVANTRIRFVLRTAANAAQFPDFVHFQSGGGCSSQVGRRGGMQIITLANACSTGNTIHEIGHAVGLWHEQSREDRDTFVRIEWANIDAADQHNFLQHIADGDDLGPYDYGSIMHYSATAFSNNGQPTIVALQPLPPGVVMGQRNGLSRGDINGVHTMYPRPAQLVVSNFAYNAGGWRVERHPRFLADLTGDRRADIIGFGNAGVWISLNNGNGTFQAPQLVVANFGYDAGGWRVEQHPRFLADLTGDRRDDIVGFGNAGVWVSLNNGNGTFQAPQLVVSNFGYNAGGWRVDQHPRFLADLTGDGRADIVGFGNAGVWVALNNGNGTFQAPQLVVSNFGYNAGGWRVDQHPRFLADLTGDGRADIVGFGNAGVWVALNNGNGTFQAPQLVVGNFGYNAGGWRVDLHPRFLADLTGDGRADIVGFGNAGVWVAINNGNGTFEAPKFVVPNFGFNAGSWRVEKHPRFLADLTGDGRADIVGFGDAGVWVSLNDGNGTF